MSNSHKGSSISRSENSSQRMRMGIRATWIASVCIAVLLVIYACIPSEHDGVPLHILIVFVLGIVSFTLILSYLVFRGDYSDSAQDSWLRLTASIIALVASILFFTLSYRQLANSSADEFVGLTTFIDSLYFTIATSLTVGFGDVYASGQVSRAMVICQMIFTVIVLAATARSLTGIVQKRQKRKHEHSNKS